MQAKAVSAGVERGGPDATGNLANQAGALRADVFYWECKQKLFFDIKDGGQNTTWTKREKYNMVQEQKSTI